MADSIQKVVTISADAAKYICQVLKRHPDKSAFRLDVKKTGCSGYMYALDVVSTGQPQDFCLETSYGFQMYIADRALPIVTGMRIELSVQSMGLQQLQFNNPNATGLCGCGESFLLKKNVADPNSVENADDV